MMRRFLLVISVFASAVIVEYWLPACVRHFVGPGLVARLVRPALCLALVVWLLACPKLRSQIPMCWRWTWVLLIPLIDLSHNIVGLFPHPKFFPTNFTIALVLDGLAIGFIEEFLFRGVAFLGSPESRPKAAVLLSAIAFSLVHFTALKTSVAVTMQEVRTQVIFALPFGVTFGIIRLATGSIAWTALMHGLIDATGYLAYPHQKAQLGPTLAVLLLCSWVATGILFFVHPAMNPKRLTMSG